MNEYNPTNPHETVPDRPVSSATSEPPPPEYSPGPQAPEPSAKQVRRPRLRRWISSRRSQWIMAAAVLCAVIGLSAGYVAHSWTTTSPSTTASGSARSGGIGSGGAGSNARSGPAAGGAAGTVGSVSTSGFTMSTATGQKVAVGETSSTTYQNGTSSTSASAVTAGENV